MFRRIILCGTFFLGLLLAATAVSAQVVTGTISGRVTDASGAVIAGATVQVQNVETGFSRNVQTDTAGRYEARNLPVGSYSVTAQQAGFRTELRRGITLAIGSEAVVNVELSVGQVQEKVEVTAEAPAVETTNATLSGLVSQQQIRDLPLNGRSYDQLALLSAGVVFQSNAGISPQNGEGLRLASNGARGDANLYLLDGTTVNDHSALGPGSAVGLSLGVEAIREFRVLTHNFSAEYGRNAGAVISAVTRSGTNEFHGSAYEFLRNNVLDARNFFNPGALPPFRQNQFGASFGGPLRKDRIFFFVNYEGFRQRQGITIIANVPDLNARQGLLPNATTGAPTPVTLNPAIVPYLNLYPVPNGRNFGNGVAQSVTNFSRSGTENYSMERMDFRLSDKDSFYWRYIYDPSEVVGPTNNTAPPSVVTTGAGSHFVVLSETHVFSAAMLNEFRFAFNRTSPGSGTSPLVVQNHALDFLPGAGFGTFAFSSASGGFGQLSNLGTASNAPSSFPQNLFQAGDSFSYVKGPHSWKFGFEVERIQTNAAGVQYVRGQYVFTALPGLLAGQPTSLSFVGPATSPERGWRQDFFGWFVQDDFRLRPNLTLNLGIRQEFVSTPTEVNGLSANLRNVTDTQSVLGPPWVSKKLNFAPRAGLAWDPTGKGKTSIRLGAGVFYSQLLGRDWYLASKNDYRFNVSYVVQSPANFPNPLLSGFKPGIASNQDMQFHADTPTVLHFSLELQQQLSAGISVHAGYVGSHGYNLLSQDGLDIRTPQILPDGSKFFSAATPIINPNFSNIVYYKTNAISNYNSLQAGLNKSFSGGLLLQANYTWSKNLSDSDQNREVSASANAVMDPSNLGADYGYAVYNQRHSFVFNSRYKPPLDKLLNSRLAKAALGGWEVNGIVKIGSGFPFGILDGFNNSQNGDTTNNPDRPNLAPGFSTNPIHGTTAGCQGVAAGQKLGTPNLWFDPCAFVLSPPGTFGNLARNPVVGPPFRNVDFAMAKNFAVMERMNLEFRAELFNIFNHANFAVPLGTVFTSQRARTGTAGVITATATANRQIQFGLKLTF